MAMNVVLNQGGLHTGGLNFDAKLRRESTDLADLFLAHIGGMDTFASGLLSAAKMSEDGTLAGWIKNRYASYDSGMGAKIESGTTNFKELEKWVMEAGEPKKISGQQEKYEMLLNQYT